MRMMVNIQRALEVLVLIAALALAGCSDDGADTGVSGGDGGGGADTTAGDSVSGDSTLGTDNDRQRGEHLSDVGVENAGMGAIAAQQRNMQRAIQADVVDEPARARHEARIFQALDPRAHMPGVLHGEAADAAGRAVDEHSLPGA